MCQDEDRDELEEQIASGLIDMRTLDRDKGWRTNTTERHMRNHAGENVTGSNYKCPICTDDSRGLYEVAYFDEGMTTEEIANEVGCSEDAVYRHMKEHFQPLVRRASTAIVSIKVGEELGVIRSNAEKLNEKLSRYLDEVSIHDDNAIGDMVRLNKEIRESAKDLMNFQAQWAHPEEKTVNNTINILKVEMAKESPEAWKRVREALLRGDTEVIDVAEEDVN